MNTSQQTLQEKIAQLKATFINQLPARLEQMQTHIRLLIEDPERYVDVLPELHRAFHSLNGTGKSFGLMDLAALAQEAEALLMQLIEAPELLKNVQWDVQLQQILAQLVVHVNTYNPSAYSSEPLALAVAALKPINAPIVRSAAPLIYICDDEPEQVDYLAHQLQCFGYQIEHMIAN